MDAEELARFWSECTDDHAPLNLAVYLSAARNFLKKYDVVPKGQMPLRYQLHPEEEDLIKQWDVGRGQMMVVPPTAEDRMADALEKMAESLEALTTTIQLKE